MRLSLQIVSKCYNKNHCYNISVVIVILLRFLFAFITKQRNRWSASAKFEKNNQTKNMRGVISLPHMFLQPFYKRFQSGRKRIIIFYLFRRPPNVFRIARQGLDKISGHMPFDMRKNMLSALFFYYSPVWLGRNFSLEERKLPKRCQKTRIGTFFKGKQIPVF